MSNYAMREAALAAPAQSEPLTSDSVIKGSTPKSSQSEAKPVYQVAEPHPLLGLVWTDVSETIYGQHVGPEDSRRVVYTAPSAAPAQPATIDHMSDALLDAGITARFQRLCKAIGYADPSDGRGVMEAGILFSAFGAMAGILERAAPAGDGGDAIDEAGLLPCPFCRKPLSLKINRPNPSARCATEGCHGRKLPILNLDQPEEIEAWNRRGVSKSIMHVRSIDPEQIAALRFSAHYFEASPALSERKIASQIRKLLAAHHAPNGADAPAPMNELHPDTAKLVQRFADAVARKLLGAQRKYGWSDNWMRHDWEEECRTELLRHIEKGDPRDVAAYCAFMRHHCWHTSHAAVLAKRGAAS